MVHNLSDRPIRRVITTCGSPVLPEFRDNSGVWKPVLTSRLGVASIASFEVGLVPGGSAEGDFTFATRREIYNTAPLRAEGEFDIRFRYNPCACFASPDASFCLTKLQILPPVVSQEIRTRASAASNPNSQ
jgi:hypothetical protein